MRTALVMTCVGWVLLGVSPSTPLPKCEADALLVSTGEGYACKRLEEVLKSKRGSGWGVEFVLPECSSGQLLESEGFGRWKCADRSSPLPSCSSGETLRSEGSSGWKCERGPVLPQCSSGELLVGAGGRDFRCERMK